MARCLFTFTNLVPRVMGAFFGFFFFCSSKRSSSKDGAGTTHTLITDWCQLLFWVLEIPCRPQASGPLAHGIPSLGSLSGFPVESRGSRSTFFRWAAAALGYTAEHWIPFWKGIPFSASPPGACTETGLFNRCISLISRCIPFVHFGFVAVTRFGEELRTLLQTRNVLCSLWCAGNKEVL